MSDQIHEDMTEISARAAWEIPPSHQILHDPLLGCLVILTRLEHHPFAPDTLISGLPLVDNKLTPELFIRAAERAGLTAKIVKRPLEEISSLVLPAVLLMKKRQAFILAGKNSAKNTYKIIQPESEHGEVECLYEDLVEEYTGYTIFIKPSYRFDLRTDEAFHKNTTSWFWGVIVKTWPLYSEVLLASLFINIFAIASSLFAMNVYDRVVPNNAIDTLGVLAVGVLIIFCFDFVFKMLRSYFVDIASKKTDIILSANIFEQMMGIKMSDRPESVGSFANNIQQFDAFREFFTSATITALIDLPFILIFLIVIYQLAGFAMLAVPLIAIPLVVFIGFLAQPVLNRMVKESYRYAGQKHAMLIESLAAVETIKSLSAESPLQRKWEHTIGMAAKLSTKIRELSAGVVTFAAFIQQVASVLVIIVGVYLIADGKMTMGALIACNILTGRALAPLGQVAGLLTRYHQSVSALSSLDKVMNMPTDRLKNKTPLHHPILKGDIEFKDVIFQYPKQSVPALNKISFKICAGEKVGIIGRIGSGKTSINKLMMNLYQTTQGKILLDGLEINQLDPAKFRRNIGYVPQDIVLFYGSVKDNIVFGSPFSDDVAILKAARVAGVTDFIARHPQGFDMPVGERGEQLSGGQRQAIAVARSLILDPPILLLDEPTNMMDSRTEEIFKNELKIFCQNKTVVIVTHKGSLLSLVDRLIVLDGGKIVADGPREAVLKALAEGKIYGS